MGAQVWTKLHCLSGQASDSFPLVFRRALPVPLSATHLSRFCTSRPAPPREEKPWEKSLQGPLPVVALFAFGLWYVTTPKSGEVRQSTVCCSLFGSNGPL